MKLEEEMGTWRVEHRAHKFLDIRKPEHIIFDEGTELYDLLYETRSGLLGAWSSYLNTRVCVLYDRSTTPNPPRHFVLPWNQTCVEEFREYGVMNESGKPFFYGEKRSVFRDRLLKVADLCWSLGWLSGYRVWLSAAVAQKKLTQVQTIREEKRLAYSALAGDPHWT